MTKIKMKFDEKYPPVRATATSAGLDLRNTVASIIQSEDYLLLKTGVYIEIPEGYVGILASRSGLGIKGLVVKQGIGVIDSDYRGEILVPLYNIGHKSMYIDAGDKIAQLLIMPVQYYDIEKVDNLSDTIRGSGGFGSTGVT